MAISATSATNGNVRVVAKAPDTHIARPPKISLKYSGWGFVIGKSFAHIWRMEGIWATPDLGADAPDGIFNQKSMMGVEIEEMQREERRIHTRHDCSRFACSCVVKPHMTAGNDPADDRFGAVVVDICCDGLCLETNLEASPGMRLYLEIRPIVGPRIATLVNVLHSRPSATSGFFIIGSEFTDLDEHDRQNLLTLLRTIARLEEDLTAC